MTVQKYNYKPVNLDENYFMKADFVRKKLKFKNVHEYIRYLINREYARYGSVIGQLETEFKVQNPQMKQFKNANPEDKKRIMEKIDQMFGA